MKPQVRLLARPNFESGELVAFLRELAMEWNRSREATQAEELVEASGRICYMSFGAKQSPKTNSEYIRHLIEMGHESVFEHVNWTFLLTGVSRAFTHQLVRHRVGFAFSQLSQQYHDESGAEFVEPLHLEKFPTAANAWREAISACRDAYVRIRDAASEHQSRLELQGELREQLRAIRSMARSILPNATETKIVVTANARALRHFLRLRGAIPGDSEMRQVAAELYDILHVEAPAMFFDFRVDALADGSPMVVHCGAKAREERVIQDS